jgi:hypothetical protein
MVWNPYYASQDIAINLGQAYAVDNNGSRVRSSAFAGRRPRACAEGRGLKARLLPIGAAITQMALVGIDPHDAALAASLLEKVIANIETQ